MTYEECEKLYESFEKGDIIEYYMRSDDYKGWAVVSDIEEDAHLGWIASFDHTQTYVKLMGESNHDFKINGGNFMKDKGI